MSEPQKTVGFAGLGAVQGGGFELGGNYTDAEAEMVRNRPLNKQVSEGLLRMVRGTIFREPSGFAGLGEDSHLSSASSHGGPSSHSQNLEGHPALRSSVGISYGGGMGWVIAALLVLAMPARMWIKAKAEAEAELMAKASTAMSTEQGVYSLLLLVALVASILVPMLMCPSGDDDDEGDDGNPELKWRRRDSMKHAGATPRLRRHNTDYHD